MPKPKKKAKKVVTRSKSSASTTKEPALDTVAVDEPSNVDNAPPATVREANILRGVASMITVSGSDLLAQKCDAMCIPTLMSSPESGTDSERLMRRIFDAGGPKLAHFCEFLGPLDSDKLVRVTSSFDLESCELLIHMASVNDEHIYEVYHAALMALDDYGMVETIAFQPPPNPNCVPAIVKAVAEHLDAQKGDGAGTEGSGRGGGHLKSVILTTGPSEAVAKAILGALAGTPYNTDSLGLDIPENGKDREELEEAVTMIQALWRGTKARVFTDINPDMIEEVREVHGLGRSKSMTLTAEASRDAHKAQKAELARKSAAIKWERAKLRLKLKLEMQKRRQEKAAALHGKMQDAATAHVREQDETQPQHQHQYQGGADVKEMSRSSSHAANVIHDLWQSASKEESLRREELALKKERARIRLRLQIRLQKAREARTAELHSHLRSEREESAARVIQHAWRAHESMEELRDQRLRKGEEKMSPLEIMATWAHAMRRLQLKQKFAQRREERRDELYRALAFAASAGKQKQEEEKENNTGSYEEFADVVKPRPIPRSDSRKTPKLAGVRFESGFF